MSFSDRWEIGRQVVEIRRPWPGEAGSMAAWIRRELDHLAHTAKKATEAADRVTAGEAIPEAAEKAEAAFYAQKDALEGWVVGQLLVGLPVLVDRDGKPIGQEPPANFGRAVMAWLRSEGWSPGEGVALYDVCMGAVATTRHQITPRAVEVRKIVDFGGPPEAKPTS